MSFKTLRSPNDSAIVTTPQRFTLRRIHVACTLGLLALAPITSFALELGEAVIRSGIGQSLLVEIPYRLAADERLTPACLGLVPAPRGDSALPTYSRVSRIAITPTHIEIFGEGRVLEPLIGLTVDVHCNTAPHFVRSYQLFVDPPARIPAILSNGTRVADTRSGAAIGAATAVEESRATPTSELRNEPTIVAATSASTASTEATTTPRATASARARGQTGGTLTQGQTYLVVRGDTLSGIAARISDRPATIREAAEAVFAANSRAFTRGDRDLIEAGRSITIPMMTAASALPAVPVAAPPPAIRVAELPTAVLLPSADLPSAPLNETPPVRLESPARATLPEAVEPPAEVATVVQPNTVPVARATPVAPDGATPPTTARASLWLTALLALGAAIALSTPVLFIRRRKKEATLQDGAKLRSSPPRQLVNPVAGFDVVEGQLARAPSGASERTAARNGADATPVKVRAAAQPDPLALDIHSIDSVDLDVGTPNVAGERVDWFADRAAAAAIANPPVADATSEDAATARMPEMDSAATVRQQPPELQADVSEPTINDEQHTLTIVELDMLREDYEAEHTLTQAANKELRDAIADLKATQAARSASADTATLEMPQPAQAETIDTQPTQKLRSSR
jgi:hypothetical protein